jgi:hypothetical protein
MAIDPLTALGIAGNVIQFVDFASKLVSKGGQYYRSADGALLQHTELSAAAENLQRLSHGLGTSLRIEQSIPSTKPYEPLREYNLAELGLWHANSECYKLAKELSKALEDLKVSGKHRRWESFRQAFRTLWSEEKIETLSKRLDSARAQLVIHLLVHLR